LKHSEDLELFEQESIQVMIDYKWETYTKNFFLFQLILYSLYLISFYSDMQSLRGDHEKRSKDNLFWCNKILGLTLHLGYLAYEAN
jgi:hypothetical protein